MAWPSTQDATNAPAQTPTIPGSQPLNGSVNTGGPAAPGSAGDASSMDVSDAIAYLDSVRDRYRDRAAVYDEFLEIMKEYKQGRSGIHTCSVLGETPYRRVIR